MFENFRRMLIQNIGQKVMNDTQIRRNITDFNRFERAILEEEKESDNKEEKDTMDKDKDTELKEKGFSTNGSLDCCSKEEIKRNKDNHLTCDICSNTGFLCHRTEKEKRDYVEGKEAGRREVLEELKKSKKPFDWISGGCDEEACKKEWCRYLEELIKQKQEKIWDDCTYTYDDVKKQEKEA